MDLAGNAVRGPLFSFANSQTPVTDKGLTFPDFNTTPGGPLFQTNLIFPVPCEFISPDLPLCAVIRPTGPSQINARGAIQGAIDDGLFIGQPKEFPNCCFKWPTKRTRRVDRCKDNNVAALVLQKEHVLPARARNALVSFRQACESQRQRPCATSITGACH